MNIALTAYSLMPETLPCCLVSPKLGWLRRSLRLLLLPLELIVRSFGRCRSRAWSKEENLRAMLHTTQPGA